MLAPTRAVANALAARGYPEVGVWGRGVDSLMFGPDRRSEELRRELLGPDGEVLLLSVGRLSAEKRIGVLLDAFAHVTREQLHSLGGRAGRSGTRPAPLQRQPGARAASLTREG